MTTAISTEQGNEPANDRMFVDQWLTTGRFAVLLAICIFAAYPEVLLGLQTFYYRDFGFFSYPLAHYHRESFWQGEIPQWNPLNNCGLPFLAQWNTLVLYPGSLFYLLFPLSWSLAVFCLLHQFLAGMGMFCLASRWTGNRLAASVAGVAYAFNGLTLNCLMWPNNIAALGWMPWVVLVSQRAWTGGRRGLAAAAAIGAMQMLSGAPEFILLTWLTLAVLAAGASFQRFRAAVKVWGRFAAMALLVAGTSAAQLLPFLDLLSHAHRESGYGDSAWAMPIWGWANLLVPMFHCIYGFHGVYWQREQYWTSSYYPGAAIVALALLAAVLVRNRNAQVLTLMAALALILALGDAGIFYGWLRRFIPQFGFMRYPVKFLVLLSFALPLLAAFAVSYLQNAAPTANSPLKKPPGESTGPTVHADLLGNIVGRVPSRGEQDVFEQAANPSQEGDLTKQSDGRLTSSRRPWAIAAIVWILLLGTIMAVVWYARLHPARDENWTLTWENGLGRALFLTLTLGVFYLYHRLFMNRPFGVPALAGPDRLKAGLRTSDHQPARLVVGLALILLLVSDLLTHVPRQNPVVSRRVFEPGLARLSPQPRHGEGRAMISPANNLKLYRFATTNAFNDYINNRQLLFANCNLLDAIPKVNGFYSLYLRDGDAVRAFLYDSTNTPPSPLCDFLGVAHISDPENFLEWKYRPDYLPLATVGQKPVFADEITTFKAITSAEFDPRQTVYLPLEARLFTSAAVEQVAKNTGPKIGKANFTAHRVEIEIEAPEPSWLVIAQNNHHCWQAFSDGTPLRLWQANYAYQAAVVPEGSHLVQLVYRDWGFAAGTVLSVLTLTGCMAATKKPRQLPGLC